MQKRITTEVLSQEIIEQLPFDELERLGGNKEKTLKKLNEVYQYHKKCFATTNRGDLSMLKELVQSCIYMQKFS